ncbi:MAG TPA: hypothetical protein VGN78_12130 [Solirubrobacteraceae bacterium]|jgi:hypothetical protein|nr:hypothetical protein [Solirubrobacteraceae bacterium]
MAFVRLFDNPEGTQEQYDAASEQLGITSENLPDGGVLHVAGPSPNGGWRVVEVWESEEAAQKFDEETLLPLLQSVGVDRPEPEIWSVHNLVVRGG